MGKGADTKSDERCPLGFSDTRLELLVVLIRDGHHHVVIRLGGIPIPARAASRQAPLGTRPSMDDICRPTCPPSAPASHPIPSAVFPRAIDTCTESRLPKFRQTFHAALCNAMHTNEWLSTCDNEVPPPCRGSLPPPGYGDTQPFPTQRPPRRCRAIYRAASAWIPQRKSKQRRPRVAAAATLHQVMIQPASQPTSLFRAPNPATAAAAAPT